jgi:MoaA/NifB/PqqE/SkfB family radical SAM enzyme
MVDYATIEEEKTRRLVSWFQGGKPGPIKIDIELHRRCNLSCLSCSRRSDPKFERINEFSKTIEMPKEKWLAIVRQAAASASWNGMWQEAVTRPCCPMSRSL